LIQIHVDKLIHLYLIFSRSVFLLMSLLKTLRTIRPRQRRLLYRNPHIQLMCKTPVQTVDDIRYRTAILLKDHECEPVSWVGLYGSFARSTQSSDSDVDLIIGYKDGTDMDKVYLAAANLVVNAEEAFGRQVELVHMMRQKVSSYLLLEALLTCVTVYGSEEWPHNVQEQAQRFLDDGYRRLKDTYSLLRRIRDLITRTEKHVDSMAN
jgi:predicted nucleotidyltransferase